MKLEMIRLLVADDLPSIFDSGAEDTPPPSFTFQEMLMDRERYIFILKLVTAVLECNKERIPLDKFVNEVVQIGQCIKVEEPEVLDVLHIYKPFDFGISTI